MEASLLLNPIADEEMKQLLSSISDDLSFIWDDALVPLEIQARMAQMGFLQLDVWAKSESSEKELRDFLKADSGIRQLGNDKYRSHISLLISTWETANIRGVKRKQEEADQLVGGLPRRISQQDHLKMTRAYNKVHKELKENESPAPCLVEDVRAKIQDGHLKAMKLSEVATTEEVEDNDDHDAKIKSDGSLKILKGSVANVSLPRTPEELRRRIKLLGVALEFVRLQFPDKGVLEKTLQHRLVGAS